MKGSSIKFGQAQIMVGEVKSNSSFKVARIKLQGRSDLVSIASSTNQILHVTLRRRVECPARMSTSLLDDVDPPFGQPYICIDGYVGVCLKLPSGDRVVCKNMNEVRR